MTTPTNGNHTGETPDLHTRDRSFNAYLTNLTGEDAPGLLGHLAIYNITGVDPVQHDELRDWFEELELNKKHMPGPPRAVDAFEKASSAAKDSYPLGGKRKRNHGSQGQTVTLMMRGIYRDETRIVRHLVRELADHENEELSYEVCLAEVQFVRSTDPTDPDGAGTMTVSPDRDEITRLRSDEQRSITDLLRWIETDYEHRTRYVSADRLRKMVRDYIERELTAVRIHQGVYFVHRRHADTLAALRTLASRFSGELTRIPLPDTAEQRQMVDGAFEAKAAKDLESLARDIATVQADPKPYQVRHLHKRYQAVKEAAEDYQTTLDTQLTNTDATLELVQAQMASLWVAIGEQQDAAGDDQPDPAAAS